VTPLDIISYHSACVDDMQGEHIGTKTRYTEAGTGWQYRFSRQTEIRSEVSCYWSLDAFVFKENSNSASRPTGISRS
jgi:hypothetical protein